MKQKTYLLLCLALFLFIIFCMNRKNIENFSVNQLIIPRFDFLSLVYNNDELNQMKNVSGGHTIQNKRRKRSPSPIEDMEEPNYAQFESSDGNDNLLGSSDMRDIQNNLDMLSNKIDTITGDNNLEDIVITYEIGNDAGDDRALSNIFNTEFRSYPNIANYLGTDRWGDLSENEIITASEIQNENENVIRELQEYLKITLFANNAHIYPNDIRIISIERGSLIINFEINERSSEIIDQVQSDCNSHVEGSGTPGICNHNLGPTPPSNSGESTPPDEDSGSGSGSSPPPSLPSNPCQNIECGAHGTCSDGRCVCEGGYSGESCQIYDECFGVDCGSHGSCSGGICVCEGVYIGEFCDNFECSDTPIPDGYVIEGDNITNKGFNITATCADGYRSNNPSVTKCTEPNQPYTFSGCNEHICNTTNSGQNIYANIPSPDRAHYSAVRGFVNPLDYAQTLDIQIECAPGYHASTTGGPEISCNVGSFEYTASGCEINKCSGVEGHELADRGYTAPSPAQSPEELKSVDELGTVTCARGYIQESSISVSCDTDGGRMTISGCRPNKCSNVEREDLFNRGYQVISGGALTPGTLLSVAELGELECTNGYELNEETGISVTCDVDRGPMTISGCQPITVPLSPPGWYGGRYEYNCNEVCGHFNLSCKEDSNWSNPPLSTEIPVMRSNDSPILPESITCDKYSSNVSNYDYAPWFVYDAYNPTTRNYGTLTTECTRYGNAIWSHQGHYRRMEYGGPPNCTATPRRREDLTSSFGSDSGDMGGRLCYCENDA